MDEDAITGEVIHEGAAALMGTCDDDTQALEYILGREPTQDEIDAFLEGIEDHIFCCDVCGWWCELSEMVDEEGIGGLVCTECAEEHEEGE